MNFKIELGSEVEDLLKASYYYKNRSSIFVAMRDDLRTKFDDDAWMKRHNVRPLRQDGTTKKPTDAEAKLAEKQANFLKERGIKTK